MSDPNSLVIRAAHGHSTYIMAQMLDEEAHEFLAEPQALCVHATYSELLCKIIGLRPQG